MQSSWLQQFQSLAAFAGFAISIVAFGWHVYTWWSEQRRCLLIFQRHEDFVNRVEQWDQGLTCFVFYVSIINNSLRTPVVILGYDLELQWRDDQFDWLRDPAEFDPPSEAYRFAGGEVSYPRQDVINHRVYGLGRLAPGDVIEGALLAKGYAMIPADYRHDQTITMKFSVLDQDNKRHSRELDFKIHKMPFGATPLGSGA
jgi:hypothetical protein